MIDFVPDSLVFRPGFCEALTALLGDKHVGIVEKMEKKKLSILFKMRFITTWRMHAHFAFWGGHLSFDGASTGSSATASSPPWYSSAPVWAGEHGRRAEPHMRFLPSGDPNPRDRRRPLAHDLHLRRRRCLRLWRQPVWPAGDRHWAGRGIDQEPRFFSTMICVEWV